MNARLDIKMGIATFSAEGDPDWIDARLSDFYDKAGIGQGADASNDTTDEISTSGDGANAKPNGNGMTLPTFLKGASIGTNQTKKFLATTIWLRDKQGVKVHSTGDVAKALKDNLQTKIKNPSQALNGNITKGFCEKTDNGQFFITAEGTQSLAS